MTWLDGRNKNYKLTKIRNSKVHLPLSITVENSIDELMTQNPETRPSSVVLQLCSFCNPFYLNIIDVHWPNHFQDASGN